MSTTLASSFDAIQWAVVAPTLPAPTIVTFLRMASPGWLNGRFLPPIHHVANNVRGKFAGLDLGGAGHEPLEIVSDKFLEYGCLHRGFDQPRGLAPAHVVEHHDAGKNYRAGGDHVLVCVLGRGPVRRLKDGVLGAAVVS